MCVYIYIYIYVHINIHATSRLRRERRPGGVPAAHVEARQPTLEGQGAGPVPDHEVLHRALGLDAHVEHRVAHGHLRRAGLEDARQVLEAEARERGPAVFLFLFFMV